MRTSLLAVASAVLLAAAVAGCGGSQDPPSIPTARCPGGDVRFLQGRPASLPGGGTAGIGAVDVDVDPVTVNLVLGDATESERQSALDLATGDTFTAHGADYRVTCISSGKVTAERVR